MSLLRGWRPPLKIALRTARRSPGRTLLVAALIGLPVLGTGWFGVLTASANPTAETLATELIGRADAQLEVTGYAGITLGRQVRDGSLDYQPAGETPRPAAEVDLPALLPSGSTVAGRTQSAGSAVLRTERDTSTYPALAVDGTNDLSRGTYRLDSGRLPRTAREVALTPALADRLGLLDGGKVRAGAEVVAEDGMKHPVVGLARPIVDPRQRALWAPPGSPLVTAPDQDPRFVADLPAGTDLAALQAKLAGQGVVLTPRATIVDPPDTGLRNDGGTAGWAIMVLAIAFGVLEIVLLAGAAFAVGARRQSRELGLVTAAGGTARDVRRIVLAQGVCTGLLGTAGGLLAAVGLAIGARPLSELVLGRLVTVWRIPWGQLTVIAVVAAVAGLLAAAVPAIAAGRLTPMAALGGRFAGQDLRTRLRRPALILVAGGVGAVLLGSSLIASAYAESQRQAAADPTLLGGGITPEGPIALVLLGITAAIAGLVWLLPNLIAKAALVGKFLPLSGRLALRDAARHRHRTGPATAAIMMAVAGTAALAFALANSFAADAEGYLPQTRDGDAVVRFLPPGFARDVPGVTYSPALVDQVAAALPCTEKYAIATLTALPAAGAGPTTFQPMVMVVAREDATIGPREIVPVDSGIYAVDPAFLDGLGEAGSRAAAAIRAGKVVVPSKDYLTADGRTFVGNRTDGGGRDGHAMPAVLLPKVPDVRILQDSASLVSVETARTLGTIQVQEVHFALTRDPTGTERNTVADLLGDDQFFAVEHGYQDPAGTATVTLLIAATVVTLLGVAISVSLSAAEGRADLATLAAVGAKPRQRRNLAGAQAWLLGQIGCVLGVGVGALYGYTAYVAFGSPYFAVPWRLIGGVVLGVPVFAGLLAWLMTRSRLPMVRRAE